MIEKIKKLDNRQKIIAVMVVVILLLLIVLFINNDKQVPNDENNDLGEQVETPNNKPEFENVKTEIKIGKTIEINTDTDLTKECIQSLPMYSDDIKICTLDNLNNIEDIFEREVDSLSYENSCASELEQINGYYRDNIDKIKNVIECTKELEKKENEGIDPDDNQYHEYYVGSYNISVNGIPSYYLSTNTSEEDEREFTMNLLDYYYSSACDNDDCIKRYYITLHPVEINGKFSSYYMSTNVISIDIDENSNIDKEEILSEALKKYEDLKNEYAEKVQLYPKTYMNELGLYNQYPISSDTVEEDASPISITLNLGRYLKEGNYLTDGIYEKIWYMITKEVNKEVFTISKDLLTGEITHDGYKEFKEKFNEYIKNNK